MEEILILESEAKAIGGSSTASVADKYCTKGRLSAFDTIIVKNAETDAMYDSNNQLVRKMDVGTVSKIPGHISLSWDENASHLHGDASNYTKVTVLSNSGADITLKNIGGKLLDSLDQRVWNSRSTFTVPSGTTIYFRANGKDSKDNEFQRITFYCPASGVYTSDEITSQVLIEYYEISLLLEGALHTTNKIELLPTTDDYYGYTQTTSSLYTIYRHIFNTSGVFTIIPSEQISPGNIEIFLRDSSGNILDQNVAGVYISQDVWDLDLTIYSSENFSEDSTITILVLEIPKIRSGASITITVTTNCLYQELPLPYTYLYKDYRFSAGSVSVTREPATGLLGGFLVDELAIINAQEYLTSISSYWQESGITTKYRVLGIKDASLLAVDLSNLSESFRFEVIRKTNSGFATEKAFTKPDQYEVNLLPSSTYAVLFYKRAAASRTISNSDINLKLYKKV